MNEGTRALMYCVYELRHGDTVFYVGAGKIGRDRQSARKRGGNPRIIALYARKTDAMLVEARAIEYYGLQSQGGALVNRDYGLGRAGPERSAKVSAAISAYRSTPQGKAAMRRAVAARHGQLPAKLAAINARISRSHQRAETAAAKADLFRALIWITDGSQSRRIPLTEPLPKGWRRGRAPSYRGAYGRAAYE